MVAGLLGIFLGAFGIHNFYLEYYTKAIIQVSVSGAGILLSCCTFGLSAFLILPIAVWGIVEGIMILTGNIAVDGKRNPPDRLTGGFRPPCVNSRAPLKRIFPKRP